MDLSFQTARYTDRSIEVLKALIEHGTTSDAALSLCISRKTVEYHIYRLRTAAGCKTVLQLVVWAVNAGLLDTSTKPATAGQERST